MTVSTSRGRFYPSYVVFVALLINALSYLDRHVVSILISPIQAELNFSDTQIGAAIGPAFMSLFLLAGMPLGHIADRYNRSVLLAIAIVTWSVGTILTGIAESFWMFALSRAIVGLGEACVVPAAYSLVADYFSAERRSRAISWVTIGTAVGSGSALFIGGLLLDSYADVGMKDWPLIGQQEPWSLVLMTFALVGIVIAALALTLRDPRGWKVDAKPTAATPRISGFTKFLRKERLGVTLVLLPYILLTYMQVAMVIWVPTLLTRRLGFEPADAATLYGTLTLTIPIVFALSGGWIADWLMQKFRAGPFLLVTWLTPIFLPGVLLFTLSGSVPIVVIGLAITLAVGGVVTTTVYSAVQCIAPNQFRGRILALYGLISQLAGVGLGPLTVGFISDNVYGDKSMLHLAIITAIVPAWIVATWAGFSGRRHFGNLVEMANSAS